MVKLAEAYFNGKKVKPIWSEGKFSFENKNTKFVFTESAKKQLFWDMGGIIKNRPSIYTLPSNPENEIFVDSGLIWGEDIIDLILADRGKVKNNTNDENGEILGNFIRKNFFLIIH